jgi:hypothetical protein
MLRSLLETERRAIVPHRFWSQDTPRSSRLLLAPLWTPSHRRTRGPPPSEYRSLSRATTPGLTTPSPQELTHARAIRMALVSASRGSSTFYPMRHSALGRAVLALLAVPSAPAAAPGPGGRHPPGPPTTYPIRDRYFLHPREATGRGLSRQRTARPARRALSSLLPVSALRAPQVSASALESAVGSVGADPLQSVRG